MLSCRLGPSAQSDSSHSWRNLRRSSRVAPHSPVPMITMVTGAGIGVPVVTRPKLAEIVVPFCVNTRAASTGAAVRPSNDGPGAYVPVMSSTGAFVVSAVMEPPVPRCRLNRLGPLSKGNGVNACLFQGQLASDSMKNKNHNFLGWVQRRASNSRNTRTRVTLLSSYFFVKFAEFIVVAPLHQCIFISRERLPTEHCHSDPKPRIILTDYLCYLCGQVLDT